MDARGPVGYLIFEYLQGIEWSMNESHLDQSRLQGLDYQYLVDENPAARLVL